MSTEETQFQERLRFLEREPLSNKNPTTGTIIYKGDDNPDNVVQFPSNVISLAFERDKRKGK